MAPFQGVLEVVLPGRRGSDMSRHSTPSARRARREILELDWPIADAVLEALGLLEQEPEAGHVLRGRLRGLRSLRVGSYRIIYQLEERNEAVRVLAVRHRSLAYGTILADI
jgi:mRNA interferase RelE/StbE